MFVMSDIRQQRRSMCDIVDEWIVLFSAKCEYLCRFERRNECEREMENGAREKLIKKEQRGK